MARAKRRDRSRRLDLAGEVVRGSGPTFYLVDERGRRRSLVNMAGFYALGLRPVRQIPDRELGAIDEGWPLRFVEGVPVLEEPPDEAEAEEPAA